MNTKIIAAVAGVIIIAGAAFWGGMAYAQSKRLSFASGQFAAGGNFMGRTGGMPGMRGGTAGTAGQIISADSGSITLKTPDGSTKIVLIGGSTQIMKTTSGSATDLMAGVDVVVEGSANSDGSITAQSVQIRPAGAFGTTTAPGR